MKLKKSTKIFLYYEGEFDQNIGKYLNSLVKYLKQEIVGLLSNKPTKSLELFLKEKEIPLYCSTESLPEFDQFIITHLQLTPNSLKSEYSLLKEILKTTNSQIINGSHYLLQPQFPEETDRIIDLRKDPAEKILFSGKILDNHSQKRILTVGMDCNIGKMTTSLELIKEFKERSLDVKFVATGQIGITITGEGIPLDRSIVDFTSGFMEQELLSKKNDILIIEGQGSLFTPRYSGLTLAQIHGCAPDYMILCVDASRKHPRYFPNIKLPSIKEAIEIYELSARLVNIKSKVMALSVNTSSMSEQEAEKYVKRLKNKFNIPVFDPIRKNQFSYSMEEIIKCVLLC